jgi:hypothetical protein
VDALEGLARSSILPSDRDSKRTMCGAEGLLRLRSMKDLEIQNSQSIGVRMRAAEHTRVGAHMEVEGRRSDLPLMVPNNVRSQRRGVTPRHASSYSQQI